MMLLSFPAFGQNLYYEEPQALTSSPPTVDPRTLPASATKPLLLTGKTSFRITVCPSPGYALTGTGSIRLYVYHPYILGGRWGYRQELDQQITITGSINNMCQVFGLRTDIRYGYLLPVTVGVGVTGGVFVYVRADPDNF